MLIIREKKTSLVHLKWAPSPSLNGVASRPTVKKVSVTPKEMMKVDDEEGSHSILDSVSSRERFPSSPFLLFLLVFSRSLMRFYWQ
jgi:hypothetical protein